MHNLSHSGGRVRFGTLQSLHRTTEVLRRQQCPDIMEMNNYDTDQLLALHVTQRPHFPDKETGTCQAHKVLGQGGAWNGKEMGTSSGRTIPGEGWGL